MVSIGSNRLLNMFTSNQSRQNEEHEEETPPFSVLISVYDGESAVSLRKALISVINQSTAPDEIVLVKDGPLSEELEETIGNLKCEYPNLFTIVSIKKNVGLGRALDIGLEHCSNSLVARMDADDISVKDRFSRQLRYLQQNPNVALVGGYMRENAKTTSRNGFIRQVPITSEKVEEIAHLRNPLNHPTVMFRKSAVKSAGGYQDLQAIQDYDLWVRMLMEGYKLTNIPEVLVTTNEDTNLYQRRGGIKYLKTEIRVQKSFVDYGFLTPLEMMRNLLIRVPIRLLPNNIRSKLYQFALRASTSDQPNRPKNHG